MLIYLLTFHLAAVFAVVAALVGRLVMLVAKQGHSFRKFFYISSAPLVISGIMLAGFGRLPISTICLQSLGLIIAIALADYGIVSFSRKIESTSSPDQK